MPKGHEHHDIDPLLPQEMALRCEEVGTAKASKDVITLKGLAVLAGAFIAFGAIFMTVTVTGAADAGLPYGVTKLLGGLVFSLGLILVVIGGAELFTGDNLMVMAWAGRKISFAKLVRAWIIVYFGNLVGAVGTAFLVFFSGHYTQAGGAVGKTALAIAQSKAALGVPEAILLGLLCNVLVCLAVWMTFSARTVAGKVVVMVPPIAAFVAAGFEHSIANMYFLPEGFLIKFWAPDAFWASIGTTAAAYGGLTAGGALINIAAVTVGNVIGGGLFVGLVYWFLYLRNR
jgi:formate transporter